MESTIKLISKYDWTLVEVIQWLDSNGHSNTKIREKVDEMLNFEKDLKKESEMELTKISLIDESKRSIKNNRLIYTYQQNAGPELQPASLGL